jgi:hypothetical protein
VRALGEPTGSRRLTDEHTAEGIDRDADPPSPRRSRPSADRKRYGDVDGRTTDERTSPFPYAEDFDEWVADETAASEAPEPRGEPSGADA